MLEPLAIMTSHSTILVNWNDGGCLEVDGDSTVELEEHQQRLWPVVGT